MDNNDFQKKSELLKRLFEDTLEMYYEKECQCSFPRYRQIVGIDCSDSGDSFTSFDTELLIDLSRKYFDVCPSDKKDENTNEKWICKKCGSVFEYGWSDFSIHVARQTLKLTALKAVEIGLSAKTPVPLFLGVVGHSYPSKSFIKPAKFNQFEKYIKEISGWFKTK